MQLEELINKHYRQMNDNDIHIWKYVSTHKKECEHLSIDELASRCHVSRTTILRFSQRLGFKGFAEFKVHLRINNESYQQAKDGMQTMYDTYLAFMDEIKHKDFRKMLELIHDAKHLYVYGTGFIQNNVASEWKRSFAIVNRLFFNIKSRDETYAFVEAMQPEDVIVMISYSGENVSLLEFAKKLKMKNIPIIAITATKDNELLHIADVPLYVEVPNIYNPLGPRYDGMATYFLFLDFLIARYADMYKEEESK